MEKIKIYYLKRDPYLNKYYIKVIPEENGFNPDDLQAFTSNRVIGCPSGDVNSLIPLPLNDLDVGINIQTRGTGVLTRGQGGNCRGDYSVDLQGLRQVGLQISRGESSTILGGRDNRSEVEHSSVGGGRNNYASGSHSTILGGRDSICSTSATYSGVGGGISQMLSGAYTSTLGGEHLRLLGNSATSVGRYNKHDVSIDRIFSVGNGTSDLNRSNAFSVSRGGNAYAGVNFTTGGADMGEYFTSNEKDSGVIPVGTSVILEESGIRRALQGEIPIGVISNTCSYIGNSKCEGKGILVGLLGQVKILKGETVSPEWIYMGNHENSRFDLWFIR